MDDLQIFVERDFKREIGQETVLLQTSGYTLPCWVIIGSFSQKRNRGSRTDTGYLPVYRGFPLFDKPGNRRRQLVGENYVRADGRGLFRIFALIPSEASGAEYEPGPSF